MFADAFFSPRTKRVVYRQDAIFLPSLFPMRLARIASGESADRDVLLTFRSPASLRDGCSRWARESKTDSRNRTRVAPEPARMREGVIEHRRVGGEGFSSESYGDSRAAKGLGEAKREYKGLRGNVVWGRERWYGEEQTHQEAQVMISRTIRLPITGAGLLCYSCVRC